MNLTEIFDLKGWNIVYICAGCQKLKNVKTEKAKIVTQIVAIPTQEGKIAIQSIPATLCHSCFKEAGLMEENIEVATAMPNTPAEKFFNTTERYRK